MGQTPLAVTVQFPEAEGHLIGGFFCVSDLCVGVGRLHEVVVPLHAFRGFRVCAWEVIVVAVFDPAGWRVNDDRWLVPVFWL